MLRSTFRAAAPPAAAAVLCLFLAPGLAGAATWTVAPDGSGDYPTIQAAVQAAQAGDLILLEDGLFRGPGNRDVSFLSKEITVRSRSGDPGRCAIDCEGSAEEPHRGFLTGGGETSETVLEAVTITRACHVWGGGFLCNAPMTVRNCVFRNNTSPGSEGGGVCVGAGALFDHCNFTENQAVNGGGAMSMAFGDVPTFLGCTFTGNEATLLGGGFRA